MKAYVRTAKGAVKTGIITSVGAGVIGGLGGDTHGLNTLSGLMPTTIGAEMGGNIFHSFRKLRKR